MNHGDESHESNYESIYNKPPEECLFFFFENQYREYISDFPRMSKKIKTLYENGAKVNFKDENDNTVLHSVKSFFFTFETLKFNEIL